MFLPGRKKCQQSRGSCLNVVFGFALPFVCQSDVSSLLLSWNSHLPDTVRGAWTYRLTMLISEMVSMLAMSRLIPTVTGPSRNKKDTISWTCHLLFVQHCIIPVISPHLHFNVYLWVLMHTCDLVMWRNSVFWGSIWIDGCIIKHSVV